MDALPVAEVTGLDFASTNGNMHACGHDTRSSADHANGKVSDMFGLSFEKLIIVGIFAAFIIGPQRLPHYAQKLGEFASAPGPGRHGADSGRRIDGHRGLENA